MITNTNPRTRQEVILDRLRRRLKARKRKTYVNILVKTKQGGKGDGKKMHVDY